MECFLIKNEHFSIMKKGEIACVMNAKDLVARRKVTFLVCGLNFLRSAFDYHDPFALYNHCNQGFGVNSSFY